MSVQQMTFDYGSLDADTRAFVEELDTEFDLVLKRTAKDIGLIVLKAKRGLPHGMYMPWIASKGISETTAWRCMQIAQGKELKSFKMKDLELEVVESPVSEIGVEPVSKSHFPEGWGLVDGKPFTMPLPDGGPVEIPESWKLSPSMRSTQGVSTVITPVQIDRGVHDEDPLERETEEDRYMRAVDAGATEYYHDDLRREAFHKDEEERASKRDAHVMRVMGSSDSPEWYTPQEIVRLSIELLGEIDLDPCSNSRETPNVPATNHYTKEDDGLLQPWEGKVYLNPPYGSEIPQWVEKLVNSYGHGVTEAIALLPARIDTVWFQPLYKFPMCNVRGRIQYENSPYHAPFPCVIAYLGERIDDFIKIFGHKGPIMRRIG